MLRLTDGPDRNEAAEAAAGSSLEGDLAACLRHLRRWLRIREARRKVRFLRLALWLPAGLALGVAAVALGLEAARRFMSGVGGAAEDVLPGAPWLADLLVSVVLMALLVGLFAALRSLGERKILRDLRTGGASDEDS